MRATGADLVARLVEATAGHRLVGDLATTPGAACFLDADLAILGAEPAAYDRYVEAVRIEYAHLDDGAFATGRLAVLSDLAARPHLYLSGRGRARFEAAARANLASRDRRPPIAPTTSEPDGAGARGVTRAEVPASGQCRCSSSSAWRSRLTVASRSAFAMPGRSSSGAEAARLDDVDVHLACWR